MGPEGKGWGQERLQPESGKSQCTREMPPEEEQEPEAPNQRGCSLSPGLRWPFPLFTSRWWAGSKHQLDKSAECWRGEGGIKTQMKASLQVWELTASRRVRLASNNPVLLQKGPRRGPKEGAPPALGGRGKL